MQNNKLDTRFKNLGAYRRPGSTAAIFFVHGFTGTAEETWGKFPVLLTGDVDLAGHDFFFWGYHTRLDVSWNPIRLIWAILKKPFWQDDPDIPTIAKSLRTLLDNTAQGYVKLILVAHSMGGLAVQQFVLNELREQRRAHLDRLTEILLYATPSNGQQLAAIGGYFKNQAANMRIDGVFINALRAHWKDLVEAKRNDPGRLARFRLTLVAGGSDRFVPPESCQVPFPNDECETVEGNHVEIVKPNQREDQSYSVLRTRLLRGTRTRHEQDIINGESSEVQAFRARVEAAVDLRDADALEMLAAELKASPLALSLDLTNTVGAALLDQKRYLPAAELLSKYLNAIGTPAADGVAAHKLAMALSYAGEPGKAVAVIYELPEEIREDPETQGILGGCFKREWIKSKKPDLALSAREFYTKGLKAAKARSDLAGIIYNGINAAYMALAINGKGHGEIADTVLVALAGNNTLDYWGLATRAEALLLKGDYTAALDANKTAHQKNPPPLHWDATRRQGLDILARMGNPSEVAALKTLLDG
jgi:predicted alpha/beta hydrolase family esterase